MKENTFYAVLSIAIVALGGLVVLAGILLKLTFIESLYLWLFAAVLAAFVILIISITTNKIIK